MNRATLLFAAASLSGLIAAGGTQAGTTISTSGSSVSIVTGSGITMGDVVVGKGPLQTEERKTAAYSGVVVEASAVVNYTVGSTPSLKVTAQANILPLVSTEIKSGKLVVGIKKSISTEKMIRVDATGPNLESVDITGSGELNLNGQTSGKLSLAVSGSGTVVANGQVDSLTADISGAGGINAEKLRAANLQAVISGSGSVSATATNSATVDLSGSGDVVIAGNPKQRKIDRSGSGEVSFK